MSVTTFEGVLVASSGAALLFHGHYWAGPLWFPASQVTLIDDDWGGGSSVLKVRDWLAKKRGLLEFTHYNEEEIEAFNQS